MADSQGAYRAVNTGTEMPLRFPAEESHHWSGAMVRNTERTVKK